MSGDPEVLVLLSTLDGEPFLPELVASLVHQRGVRPRLLAHDDGSTDGSASGLVDAVAGLGGQVVGDGQRWGVPRAFLELIARAGDADAFAFADQDDLWHTDKLSAATRALADADRDRPALWMCNIELVRSDGMESEPTPQRPPRVLGLSNALVENPLPGCAMVWNPPLQHLLQERLPDQVRMHDAWVYLVASLVGDVILDARPLVTVRLHGSNAVGIDRSPLARLRRWGAEEASTSWETQANELLRCFGDLMSPSDRDRVRLVANGRALDVTRAFATGRLTRQRRRDNPLMTARLVMGPRRR